MRRSEPSAHEGQLYDVVAAMAYAGAALQMMGRSGAVRPPVTASLVPP